MGRRYDDDDGRTVADMSDLERPQLLGLPMRRRDEPVPAGKEVRLDRSERRAMLRGALSAGLLVAGALALGFAILIVLIQLVWG